jgi:hypothetical protein
MKSIFSWYNFGTLILFLGLLWMFLPHAAHELLLSEIEEAEHYVHILQGTMLTLAGIGFLVLEQKRNRSSS